MGDRRHLGTDHVDPVAKVGIVLHDPGQVRVDGGAVLLANRGDQKHVGTFLFGPHLEPLVGELLEHARGEGAKALPELDLQVHRGLHLSVPRVTQDAAGPQSTGTELHAAVEPADDLAGVQ